MITIIEDTQEDSLTWQGGLCTYYGDVYCFGKYSEQDFRWKFILIEL